MSSQKSHEFLQHSKLEFLSRERKALAHEGGFGHELLDFLFNTNFLLEFFNVLIGLPKDSRVKSEALNQFRMRYAKTADEMRLTLSWLQTARLIENVDDPVITDRGVEILVSLNK